MKTFFVTSRQGSKRKKISALPFSPSSLQASSILVTDQCKHQQPVALMSENCL